MYHEICNAAMHWYYRHYDILMRAFLSFISPPLGLRQAALLLGIAVINTYFVINLAFRMLLLPAIIFDGLVLIAFCFLFIIWIAHMLHGSLFCAFFLEANITLHFTVISLSGFSSLGYRYRRWPGYVGWLILLPFSLFSAPHCRHETFFRAYKIFLMMSYIFIMHSCISLSLLLL